MKKQQLNFKQFSSSTFSQTKEEIDDLLTDKKINRPIQINFLINLIVTGLVIGFWPQLTPQIPLFYSRTWGEAQLADKAWLWLIPAGLWLTILINLRFSSRLFNQEKIIALALVWGSLLGSIIAGIALIEIIWLIV